MTSRLSAISTLENVVLAIPRITLDNIGGTNIKLYYFIDNQIYCSDALGECAQPKHIDDDNVIAARETRQSMFLEHDFSDTMMMTPEFEKAWDWIYPLTVGEETIGVLKMENLHIGVDEWREYLPTFFGYAALLLKNEILGYTKLKKAYDELAAEVEVRKEAEEELELLNDKLSSTNAELEEEIAVRMETEEELEAANTSLVAFANELEHKVEERTKELSESNKKLQAATELAEIAYWEYDPQKDVFVFNDYIYELIFRSSAKEEGGYEIGSMALVKKYVHPEDTWIIPAELAKIFSPDNKDYFTPRVSLRLIIKNRVVYLLTNSRIAKDEASDTLKLIGACQDVTKQKLAQMEIERISSEWVQAMDAFEDMIYLVDTKRRLIRANKKFYDAMKINDQKATGMIVSDITHPHIKPHECPVCMAHSMFEDKSLIVEADEPHNPTSVPLEVTIKTIRDENGEPIAILTSLHDLSHTRKIEQELRVLNESLELRVQAELAKSREKDLLLIRQSRLAAMGEMITNIAHQWRQPLTALAITIQDAKYAFDGNELNAEYIDKMVKDGMGFINYMSHTIDDFRSFFRPDRQKESFSVVEACELASHVIYDSLKSNFIKFEMHYEDANICTVGYPHEFSQVILNLLSNAKDVLLDRNIMEPTIYLSVSKCNGSARINIEDNGGGIDATIVDKVFDPYFTTKEQGKGTGLGLYMSKMIVEQHMNGKIYADNGEKGAVFVIELPSDELTKRVESVKADKNT